MPDTLAPTSYSEESCHMREASVSSSAFLVLPHTLDTRKCFQLPFTVCIRNIHLASSVAQGTVFRYNIFCRTKQLILAVKSSLFCNHSLLSEERWDLNCLEIMEIMWGVRLYLTEMQLCLSLLKNQFLPRFPASSECPHALGFTLGF